MQASDIDGKSAENNKRMKNIETCGIREGVDPARFLLAGYPKRLLAAVAFGAAGYPKRLPVAVVFGAARHPKMQ